MTKLRYFGDNALAARLEEDDPFSPFYVPVEKRGRLEQSRWWAKRANRKDARPAVAELDERRPGEAK